MGKLVEVKDVKKPKEISHTSRHNDGVLIPRVRCYFEEADWKEVVSSLQEVNKMVWLCTVCKTDVDDKTTGCDSCLQ